MLGERGVLCMRRWLAPGLWIVTALLGLMFVGATASAASTPTYLHAYAYDAQHHGVTASSATTERGPPAGYVQDRSAIAIKLWSRSAASCSDVPASPGPPSYDDPTLHARDPRVTGPIDGGRAWGDSGALSLAGRSSVAAKTAESAADAALTAGRTSGAAAELRAGGQVFTDVSTGGSPRVLNGAVQDALDAVPLKQQTPWHGACAEMGCLSQALDAGVNPAGGSIRAVAIGSSNPGHGLPKVICSSCANVLDVFGVNH